MDDRSLVQRLLDIGVAARRRGEQLTGLRRSAVTKWSAMSSPASQTPEPVLNSRLPTQPFVSCLIHRKLLRSLIMSFNVVRSPPKFDVFISYAVGDAAIADELRGDLEGKGLRCFVAEKDIQVATEWQESIREALVGSTRILVLLTPRSINRPWVLTEIGAAWALGKPLIPALSHVGPNDLGDPIRRHQGRVIETTAQRRELVNELAGE